MSSARAHINVCSTTCDECDSKCASYGHCKSKCYQRFRQHVAKPLDEGLFPLDSSDAWCAFAVFLATVFASAAGIGGGAVLVPLFTLIGQFTEHEAIPLALSTVFLQAASETAAALGVAMRGRMYALLAFSSALGLVMEGRRDRC